MEQIVLVGAENVQSAGAQMKQAADQISQSVGYYCEAVDRHERFLRELLDEFRQILSGEGKGSRGLH